MANWDEIEEVENEDILTNAADDAFDTELGTVEVADDGAGAKKPQRRRQKSVSISKGQALQVLNTYRAVQGASSEARSVLRAVVRADDEVTDEELTAAVLSQDRSDNPLSTLDELRDALAASPFTVPAIIAGMEKSKRNRAYAVLSAAAGISDTLPTRDVEAAGTFAQHLSELTKSQLDSLDEARDLGH